MLRRYCVTLCMINANWYLWLMMMTDVLCFQVCCTLMACTYAGLDWGGVQREFLHLLCCKLFDASGLFTRFTQDQQALVRACTTSIDFWFGFTLVWYRWMQLDFQGHTFHSTISVFLHPPTGSPQPQQATAFEAEVLWASWESGGEVPVWICLGQFFFSYS